MWADIVELVLNNHSIFFTIVTTIVVSAALVDIRNRNVPPGPMGLPFVGYVPFLDSKVPYKKLTALTQQYGRIFGLQLGSIYAVVVADVKVIRQTLRNSAFSVRGPLFLKNGFRNGLKENCVVEEEQEKAVSVAFRDAVEGMNIKENAESQIQQSVRDFLQDARSQLEDEQDLTPSLRSSVGKLMTGIMIGNRFEGDNSNWSTLETTFVEMSKFASVTNPINYIPALRKIPNYAKTIRSLIASRQKSKQIFTDILTRRRLRVANEGSKINSESVLDAYLEQVAKYSDMNGIEEEIVEEVLLEVITGEWETILTTLQWIYLYMALYPEIQETVTGEVLKVVGGKREVQLDDLKHLPYTEATVLEIWRHRTVVPFGVPRAVKEKTKVGDYIVPSETMVIPLLWAVNHDSRLWEHPEIFSPERFLFEEGCIFRNENLLPLQTGKDAIFGESLIRWTTTLFLANTLNQFQIQFPKDYGMDLAEDYGELGSTLMPNQCTFLLQNRFQ